MFQGRWEQIFMHGVWDLSQTLSGTSLVGLSIGSTFTFGDTARDPDLMVKTFLRRLENSPFSVFAPSLPFAAFGGTAFRAKRTLAGFIPNPFINPKSYPLSQTWMSPNTTLSIYYVVVVPKGRAEWLVY